MNKFNVLGNIMLGLGIILIGVSVHFRIDRLEKIVLNNNIIAIDTPFIVKKGPVTIKEVNNIPVKVEAAGEDFSWYYVWYDGKAEIAKTRRDIKATLERMKKGKNRAFADSMTKVLNEYE